MSALQKRLAGFLRALAQLSVKRFMTNSPVNDMVEDAMVKSWSVCLRYTDRVQEDRADHRGWPGFRRLQHRGRAGQRGLREETMMVCLGPPDYDGAERGTVGRPDIEQVLAFALRGLGARPVG